MRFLPEDHQDGCTNEVIGRMIAGYRLGTLSESERAVFIEHIFYCPHCHENVYTLREKGEESDV